MSDRNNSFLVANADGVYSSAHVAQMPDGQAYNAEKLSEVKVKYYEFLKQTYPEHLNELVRPEYHAVSQTFKIVFPNAVEAKSFQLAANTPFSRPSGFLLSPFMLRVAVASAWLACFSSQPLDIGPERHMQACPRSTLCFFAITACR